MISIPPAWISQPSIGVLSVFLVLFALVFYTQKSKPKFPLPPGPKGAPILGNLRQVPTERSDLHFAKWSQEYSTSPSPHPRQTALTFPTRLRYNLLQHPRPAIYRAKQREIRSRPSG